MPDQPVPDHTNTPYSILEIHVGQQRPLAGKYGFFCNSNKTKLNMAPTYTM